MEKENTQIKIQPFIDTVSTLYIDFDGVIYNTMKAITACYNDDYKYYDNFIQAYVSNLYRYDMTDMCPLASHEELLKYFNNPRLYDFWCECTLLDNELYCSLKKQYNMVCVTLGTKPNLRIKNNKLK